MIQLIYLVALFLLSVNLSAQEVAGEYHFTQTNVWVSPGFDIQVECAKIPYNYDTEIQKLHQVQNQLSQAGTDPDKIEVLRKNLDEVTQHLNQLGTPEMSSENYNLNIEWTLPEELTLNENDDVYDDIKARARNDGFRSITPSEFQKLRAGKIPLQRIKSFDVTSSHYLKEFNPKFVSYLQNAYGEDYNHTGWKWDDNVYHYVEVTRGYFKISKLVTKLEICQFLSSLQIDVKLLLQGAGFSGELATYNQNIRLEVK